MRRNIRMSDIQQEKLDLIRELKVLEYEEELLLLDDGELDFEYYEIFTVFSGNCREWKIEVLVQHFHINLLDEGGL